MLFGPSPPSGLRKQQRFRGVSNTLRPQHALQPAKSGVALKLATALQDAPRTRGAGAWRCHSHGSQASATASWTAVTEMHGASLHRRHRFRGVRGALWPQPAVRPAKAAALSRGVEYSASPARPPACEKRCRANACHRSPAGRALASAALGTLHADGLAPRSRPEWARESVCRAKGSHVRRRRVRSLSCAPSERGHGRGGALAPKPRAESAGLSGRMRFGGGGSQTGEIVP